MKYTLEQRLDIGRRIYEGEITRFQAAQEYDINDNTARNYMRLYRDTNKLPPKNGGRKNSTTIAKSSSSIEIKQRNLEEYESMTKEELIQALVQARIETCELDAGVYYIEVISIPKTSGRYTMSLSEKGCDHLYKATRVVNPTYFSKGYTIYTCTECGRTKNDTYKNKLIIPRESIIRLQAGVQKMGLSWNEVSGVSGYQIRYSTDRSFKKNVNIVNVKGAKNCKKTIYKLRTNQTYYAQVRAYASKSGVTVYGKWSAAKGIKIK